MNYQLVRLFSLRDVSTFRVSRVMCKTAYTIDIRPMQNTNGIP